MSNFLQKPRNKAILSVYLFFVCGSVLSAVLNPKMSIGEKLFILCFNIFSATLFAFLIYLLLNKLMKDEDRKHPADPEKNGINQVIWKKYKKPLILFVYFGSLFAVCAAILPMPIYTVAEKLVILSIAIIFITICCILAYKVTNKMLQK
ncbi:hypothetical protein SFC27_15070 [Bacillus licheniformis]|jgi:predicted permease|uniref:Uncharacterized protein n=4 Tax=Bacillus licheniformis TaxID=1402 RepID=Q65NH8_BACLD|nr:MULTISPECIES: hypothetical protein [Bacillus]MBJ7885310.1 hypothetical protein [Bacillaceae bacterium HSR45]MBY8349026.1 hypothetical protein [Bacillus sp. PCH94]MDP4081530.1 hypothetical protein [Bacillota bacterium]AAU22030.1 hypothetical protein BL01832 [Bacillus licheniformis DSM 13 = ATCC 14580]AAU39386.1 putative transmembrane protein [Bacillus licheniformis DSM 13 = ATCC 14580]